MEIIQTKTESFSIVHERYQSEFEESVLLLYRLIGETKDIPIINYLQSGHDEIFVGHLYDYILSSLRLSTIEATANGEELPFGPFPSTEEEWTAIHEDRLLDELGLCGYEHEEDLLHDVELILNKFNITYVTINWMEFELRNPIVKEVW